jgi:hypothetical protein
MYWSREKSASTVPPFTTAAALKDGAFCPTNVDILYDDLG